MAGVGKARRVRVTIWETSERVAVVEVPDAFDPECEAHLDAVSALAEDIAIERDSGVSAVEVAVDGASSVCDGVLSEESI